MREAHIPLGTRPLQVITGTVSENLFFGLTTFDGKKLEDEKIERGLKICQQLKFPKRLYDLAKDSVGVQRNYCSVFNPAWGSVVNWY